MCGSAKAPEHGNYHKMKMPPRPKVEPRWKQGLVSYYGKGFDGRRMANGERFRAYYPYDGRRASVAHKSLAFGTIVRFRNPANQKTIEAVVTDRGPYVHGREFDLSHWGALKVGMAHSGVQKLEYTIIGRTSPRKSA